MRINLGLFQHDVNVIWDLAPHDLSIVDHVLGGDARSISAWGCAHADPAIEDIAYVNVDYGDRLMASFHVNWLSPVKVRQMIFAGSKKSLIFNELNTTEPIKVYDRGVEFAETEEERRRLHGQLPERGRVEPAHRAGRGAAGGGDPLRRVHPQWRGADQRRPAWAAGGEAAGVGDAEHPGPGRAGRAWVGQCVRAARWRFAGRDRPRSHRPALNFADWFQPSVAPNTLKYKQLSIRVGSF